MMEAQCFQIHICINVWRDVRLNEIMSYAICTDPSGGAVGVIVQGIPIVTAKEGKIQRQRFKGEGGCYE